MSHCWDYVYLRKHKASAVSLWLCTPSTYFTKCFCARQEWCWRGWFRQRTKEHLVTPPRRECIPMHLLHQSLALICSCLVCTDSQLFILRPTGYTHSRISIPWKQNSNTGWSDSGVYLWRVKGKSEGHFIILWSLKKWWHLLLLSLLYLFHLIFLKL